VTERAARLWHPRLRINRVLRVVLHTRWSAECQQVRAEIPKLLAFKNQIRRAGWQLAGAALVQVVAFG
jgi:hypothetical protein